jgi:hypothetical protein
MDHNTYIVKQAQNTCGGCFICYKPTGTVLKSEIDWFYCCPGHFLDISIKQDSTATATEEEEVEQKPEKDFYTRILTIFNKDNTTNTTDIKTTEETKPIPSLQKLILNPQFTYLRQQHLLKKQKMQSQESRKKLALDQLSKIHVPLTDPKE